MFRRPGKPTRISRIFDSIERFVKFFGSLGIIFSAFLFLTTIQRNSIIDVATAWQLLSQDKPGNYGRAHALNTLATSHCLIKYDQNRKINSYKFGFDTIVPQCLLSGSWFLDGPQSLFGIDLSSRSSGISLVDKLFISSVEIRNANFENSSLKTSTITNSNVFDTSFEGFYTTGTKFIGNLFSMVKMDCGYINRSTFHDNIFKSVSLNYSRIIFSHLDFYSSVDNNKRSFQLSMDGTVVIDSLVNLSNLYNVSIIGSKFIRSFVNFDNVEYINMLKSDFTDSVLVGNLSASKYPTFVESNISGSDMQNLTGLSPNELEKSFYCAHNPPKLPIKYSGNAPSVRQCISDTSDKIYVLVNELQKYYTGFPNATPTKVFYTPINYEGEAKLHCGPNPSAVEKLSRDTGLLIFDKGKAVIFTNISAKTPIASQLIEIGNERGAETVDRKRDKK